VATDIENKPLDHPQTSSGDDFLVTLGTRVREIRDRRGMARKLVAREAGVSERHLAHLEAGDGNVSIMLLRGIARALDERLIRRFLERLPQQRLEEVVFRLMRDFGHEEAVRRKRIALIGLRGAGKSTLGTRLAREQGVPFIELDREIAKDTGMPSSEIFSLYGQTGYRRIEKSTLERIIREHRSAVISVGGGVVAEAETYSMLLSNCYTIWVRARPEEHMARVVAQGDLRPMAGNEEAMDNLRRILEARESLYAKADMVIDTSGESVEASYTKLRQLAGG
jgi:XRE family aerobic/anaerobic benzoate catabolism transcriptional regulator